MCAIFIFHDDSLLSGPVSLAWPTVWLSQHMGDWHNGILLWSSTPHPAAGQQGSRATYGYYDISVILLEGGSAVSWVKYMLLWHLFLLEGVRSHCATRPLPPRKQVWCYNDLKNVLFLIYMYMYMYCNHEYQYACGTFHTSYIYS
jgi:hypothetical protein